MRLIIAHPVIDSDINHDHDFIRSVLALSSAIYLMYRPSNQSLEPRFA